MATGVKNAGPAPTVEQINADRITQLANKYWAPHTIGSHQQYSPQVVENIYNKDIKGSGFAIRRIMMLEFSQYLENYLWPNYTADASIAHVISIVVMVNEKFRERVPAFMVFKKSPDQFGSFIRQLMEACLQEDGTVGLQEQTNMLVFLNHCFNSMEVEVIRKQVQRLVSLPMWVCLLESRREMELRAIPRWKKFWKTFLKKEAKEDQDSRENTDFDRRFLCKLMEKFIRLLMNIPADSESTLGKETVQYCERFLELMVDLEALLPTRRFFNTAMDDRHLVVLCCLSPLLDKPEGRLFTQDMSRASGKYMPVAWKDVSLPKGYIPDSSSPVY